MTEKDETLAPNQKKIIDWDKKSASDASRIGKRLSGRAALPDQASTDNSISRLNTPKPSDKALRRLRQKIREVYDEEDEEENASPDFFNINLLGETEDAAESTRRHTETETIRITKEQQLAGKLNAILSTSLAAKEAGLPPSPTSQDARLANAAEYDIPGIRRKTLKQKVSEPLHLKGELKEDSLPNALHGIRKTRDRLPEDALNDYPASDAEELDNEDTEAKLAKLILKKSGRRAPNKKLSELVRESSIAEKTRSAKQNGNENA